MVNRKTKNVRLMPEEPLKLLVSQADALDRINVQINRGDGILKMADTGLDDFIEFYKRWNDYNKTLISTLFSGDKLLKDYDRHTYISFSMYGGAQEKLDNYIKLSTRAINELKSIKERIELIPESQAFTDSSPVIHEVPTITSNVNIFVVHGHNNELKESVARILGKLSLNPIILHERPNEGMTVIEKFEKNADVGFAVVLLTGDDQGGKKGDVVENLNIRSRQNVVFELGFFIGKLDRKRVCAIYEDGVELPSDTQGILYIKYDSTDSWRYGLCKELRAAGYQVDMNQI